MNDELKKQIIWGYKEYLSDTMDEPKTDKEFEQALNSLECLKDDINYLFERINKVKDK